MTKHCRGLVQRIEGWGDAGRGAKVALASAAPSLNFSCVEYTHPPSCGPAPLASERAQVFKPLLI